MTVQLIAIGHTSDPSKNGNKLSQVNLELVGSYMLYKSFHWSLPTFPKSKTSPPCHNTSSVI